MTTPNAPPRDGRAWSEDPDGVDLSAIRIDPPGGGASFAIPRRGPIALQAGWDPAALSTVRERLRAAERQLGGPVVVGWRAYGDQIDTGDERLIDEPLGWDTAWVQRRGAEDRWSRANAGEIFPDVITPLTWSLVGDPLDRAFGMPWGDLARGRRFVTQFDGYTYFNIGLILHLFEDRLGIPGAEFLRVLGGPDAEAELGSHHVHWGRLLRNLGLILRTTAEQRTLGADWEQERAAGEAERDRLRALDAASLSERDLLRELTRSGLVTSHQVEFLIRAQAGAFSTIQALLWLSDRWLDGGAADALSLLQGLPGVRTAEGSLALWRIAERAAADADAARFVAQTDSLDLWPALHRDDLPPGVTRMRDDLIAFLAEFGHRAAGELEVAQPRWAEHPELILSTFRGYVLSPGAANPASLVDRQIEARQTMERQIERQLRADPLGDVVPLRWWFYRTQMRQSQALQPLRENPKFTLLEVSLQQRRLWLELGQRWVGHGVFTSVDDVFYLLFDELAALIRRADDPIVRGRMASRIRRRRRQAEIWSAQPPPPLRDRNGSPIAAPQAPQPPVAPAADAPAEPPELKGIAASPGTARGRAYVAASSEEGRRLTAGEVLVARFTDPGWTPIFPLAAAVVTEIGGVLSHGAIVAREYGIPAVVNVRKATEAIRSGDLIEVDGAAGRVQIIERGTAPA